MSELPAGWTESPLVDLISEDGLFSDGDWVESKDQDPNGAIRLLQLADIGDGKFLNKSNRFVNDEKFELLNCTEILEGDVLVARMPDPLGRACLMPKLPQKCITVVDVAIIRPGTELVSTNWLMHFLNSPEVRQEMQLLSSGSTRKRISRGNLSQIVLPVPPPNEQKRIAGKLDSLLARVDSCQTHLERVPQILKRFRQSVLAAAFRGELTERDSNDEPVSVLLTRLQTERMVKSKKTDEPELPDTLDLPELPDGWAYTLLYPLLSLSRRGMKTGPFGSALKKSDHIQKGVPVLGIENIGRAKFIAGSKIHISKAKAEQLSEYDAVPGDILISRSGTVGEVCVVPDDIGDARISTNLIRLSLVPNGVLPQFFCLLFNGSPLVLNQVDDLCKGSTRPFLNQTILSSIVFPIPPLAEQYRIIAAVDRLFAYAERLEARYTSASEHVERLTPSLLAKAFRGELVEQDARDESAEVLVERIRKAREEVELKETGPRRKRIVHL